MSGWKDAPTLETLIRDEYGKGNDAGFNWRELPGIAADKASQVGSAISNMLSGSNQPSPGEMPKTTSTQTLIAANPPQWWELIPELMMNPQLLVNPHGKESSIVPVGAYTKNKRAALVSMGSEYDDISRGLKDLYARATGDDAARQQYTQESAQKRGLLESLRSDYPGSTLVGAAGAYAPIPVGASSEAVGGLMAKVGMEKAGPAVANSLLADSAFTGTGIGAVNYEDDALWGGLMGAAGYKTMQTIGKLFSKPPNFNSKSANEIIDKARERFDWSFLPGERTGNRTLLGVDTHLKSNVATMGQMGKIAASNQAKANKIAAESLGIKLVPNQGIDESVLSQSDDMIQKEFENLAKTSKAKFSMDEVNKLVGIVDDYESVPGANPIVRQWRDLIFDSANTNKAGEVVLDGKEYKRLMTRLRQKSSSLKTSAQGDREAGLSLDDLRSVLDDAIGEGSNNKAAWADVRKKYAILKTLEKPNVTNTSTGNVNIVALAKEMERNYGKRFTRGADDSNLALLGRVGKLQRDQGKGQGLSLAHGLSEILRGGNRERKIVERALKSTITGGGMGTPASIGSKIYASGYPTVTGLLGPLSLSQFAPGLLGVAGARSTYGEGNPMTDVGLDSLKGLLGGRFSQ